MPCHGSPNITNPQQITHTHTHTLPFLFFLCVCVCLLWCWERWAITHSHTHFPILRLSHTHHRPQTVYNGPLFAKEVVFLWNTTKKSGNFYIIIIVTIRARHGRMNSVVGTTKDMLTTFSCARMHLVSMLCACLSPKQAIQRFDPFCSASQTQELSIRRFQRPECFKTPLWLGGWFLQDEARCGTLFQRTSVAWTSRSTPGAKNRSSIQSLFQCQVSTALSCSRDVPQTLATTIPQAARNVTMV